MTDEHFRALRTLILDQNVKIEALSAEVRRLRQAIENSEPVEVKDNRISAEELDGLLRIRQFPEPRSGN
ncbi:hypothetical protein ELG88_09725 [Rhizobium leguminosarum]|uniref:hypothetical protein n=1 Tax=Rhizobium leguminosarum TaxID=384 RepID=UPI00102F8529|nr:hypothetical protein [Rhizobium leguminosarum]TBF35466.1 hypothetical protein ELG88_09725 [Rhizobium leguminosarum]